MDCDHAPDTLLWLYGEAPEPTAHLAACAACRAIVAEHTDVALALGPSGAALRSPAPRAGAWGWAAGAVGLLAVAAAVVATLRVGSPPPSEPPDAAGATVAPAPIDAWAVLDPFDAQLDALDREVDGLAQDLETL